MVIGGRLTYIATGERFISAARSQSLYSLTIDHPRGTIFDRNLIPLTNRTTINKTVLTSTPQVISAIHRYFFGKEKEVLLSRLTNRKPFVITAPTTFSAMGATEVACHDLAPDYQPALHLTGYLNHEKDAGMTGLQKAYDTLLSAEEDTTVTYACDALGGALPGISPEIKKAENKKGVITTLSSTLQTIAEEIFPSHKKGAVVIQKAGSGEVLSSMSSPTFSLKNLENAINDTQSPLLNRSLTEYNVGSIFKLFVAAAALEQGVSPLRKYTCTGSIDCGETFGCHEEKGHGELTMEEAMAFSCNTYFIDLAMQVGGQAIYDMAVSVGLGQPLFLCDGIVSQEGNLPNLQELLRSPAELANFAIGQGAFLATPMQISAAVSTVVNDGIYFPPYLVTGFVDEKGQSTYKKATVGRRVFGLQTAAMLKDMMEKVMREGTGMGGASDQVGSGGKTATAQTGMVNSHGQPITQSWFVGYFPAHAPRYTVTILVEDGVSGGVDAAPLFGEFCRRVTELGNIPS
jgi:penicillin-binding protein 2